MPSKPLKGMGQVGLTGFSKCVAVPCDLPDLDTLHDRFDSDAFSKREIASRRDAKAKRLRRDAKAGHLKTQCGVVKGRTSKVLVLLFLDATRANHGFFAVIQGPSGLGGRRNMVVVRFVFYRFVA